MADPSPGPAFAASTAEITTVADLESVLGTPAHAAANKARSALHPLDVRWIAHSRMIFIATSAAGGTCDVSPKGDSAGFVRVLDAHTLAIPERPGNGRTDTFRVNGRARLLRDAPYFDAMAVGGRRPALAMEVRVEEVFYHCAKAFLRSQLWEPGQWAPGALPSRARIVHALERSDESLAEIEHHYGPSYAQQLY